MPYLIPVGRIFLAFALMGLGSTHFIFGDFMTGRAPGWPESVPGRLIWAYLTGAIFIGTGLGIIFKKKGRNVAMFAGTLIFLWALLRYIPVLTTTSFLAGEWTGAGKALTLVGGMLAIAGTLPKKEAVDHTSFMKFINLSDEFITIGRICLGIFLIITGIQHFMFTEFVASLIPRWFSGNAVFWTYFGGIALISGGVGLLLPQTAHWAALLSGIMVFSWFWIIHLPRTFLSTTDGIAVFEALAVSGIAFVIAGFLYHQRKNIEFQKDSPDVLNF